MCEADGPQGEAAFTQCVCDPEVCAVECEVDCAGYGISGSCIICTQKAGAETCSDELEQCGGVLEDCSSPADCYECVACADYGQCYDVWHACWADAECEAVLNCDFACLDAHPAAQPLVDAYLHCVVCDACAVACPDAAVDCGGP
jgi:hypothetical protein